MRLGQSFTHTAAEPQPLRPQARRTRPVPFGIESALTVSWPSLATQEPIERACYRAPGWSILVTCMGRPWRWQQRRDPLFRGDDASGVSAPVPSSDPAIVRHILYLGGLGRETPYVSTTESEGVAEHFAGRDGRVFKTSVQKARAVGVKHISRAELLSLLKGEGRGVAKWDSAHEVLQARRYVEEWLEHLFDFREISPDEAARVRTLVNELFDKA